VIATRQATNLQRRRIEREDQVLVFGLGLPGTSFRPMVPATGEST
jgi:hypothetical protein